MKPLVLEEDTVCGDKITASIDHENRIQLEVDEPWTGDTEHGFGHCSTVRLSKAQALQLADWLQDAGQP